MKNLPRKRVNSKVFNNMKITLSGLAELVEGELRGAPDKIIRGAAPFEKATGEEITYAADVKFIKRISDSKAGAIIVPKNVDAKAVNLICVQNPQVAFVKVLNLFFPPSRKCYGLNVPYYIGKNFVYGKDLSLGPFVVIQDNVTVGDRVTLHPHVVIGDNVTIGDDVEIYPNVAVLNRCQIGSRVTIHAGTVIGSDGFGFAPDGEIYHKIPHTGFVQIDDDVEIGAGNTIDRATFGRTWIQKGVKTDNLVHIAHNVVIGEHTVLVAQVGISGSVSIGKHAILAGQAGITGHLEIGDNAIVGPQAGVTKSIPSGEVVSGSPEMPHKIWLRIQRIIPRLPELKKKIEELEKRLEKIEKNEPDEKPVK